jgi:hypothetical protein
MKQLFILITFAILIGCNTEEQPTSQNNNTATDSLSTTASKEPVAKNDWAKKNLKGAVKERTVWVYAAGADGQLDEDKLKGGIEVSYNKAGNKATWKSYDEKKQLLDAWEYLYNPQGQLKECKIVTGPVVRNLYYRYNKQNQLEHSAEHTNGSTVKATTYQYDEKGNMILSHSYFEGSTSETKNQQKFNAQNQLVELQVYDEQDVVQLKKIISYNKQGLEAEQAIYSGSNIPSYKRQFEYDDKGNCIKDWAYLENGQLNEKDAFNYQYTYDEQGNWLTKVKLNTQNQILEHSTQTIVYF